MDDLFPDTAQHDPGGKVKTKLNAGIKGDALFVGDRQEYRPVLRRWIGEEFGEYVVFIGMNPSTADANANDPTITREWTFAKGWGFNAMVKHNVADYRATDPKTFNDTSIVPSSHLNLDLIRGSCNGASRIILCHGKLIKPLQPYGEKVVQAIVADGHKIWCFGRNGDGSPKHPLYLKSSAELIPFA